MNTQPYLKENKCLPQTQKASIPNRLHSTKRLSIRAISLASIITFLTALPVFASTVIEFYANATVVKTAAYDADKKTLQCTIIVTGIIKDMSGWGDEFLMKYHGNKETTVSLEQVSPAQATAIRQGARLEVNYFQASGLLNGEDGRRSFSTENWKLVKILE